MIFTLVVGTARIERRFTPDQVIEAARQLRDCKNVLRECGFVVLLQGEDNVVHIAHREPAR